MFNLTDDTIVYYAKLDDCIEGEGGPSDWGTITVAYLKQAMTKPNNDGFDPLGEVHNDIWFDNHREDKLNDLMEMGCTEACAGNDYCHVFALDENQLRVLVSQYGE